MFVILSAIVLGKSSYILFIYFCKCTIIVVSLKLLLVDLFTIKYSNTSVETEMLLTLLISTWRSNRDCCFATVFLKLFLVKKQSLGKKFFTEVAR